MKQIEIKPFAREMVKALPQGGRIVTGSGGVTIERVEGLESGKPIRWTVGRVATEVTDKEAVKRLSAYRPEITEGMAIFGPDGRQLAPSKLDNGWCIEILGAPEGYGERIHVNGHIELARRKANEVFDELGGAYEVAVTDQESGKRKHTIYPKGQSMTSKNGAAKKEKAAKKEIEVPRGFKIGTGADVAVGDLVVTDAEQGPERVVSIGSGGVSRGREYLKLMLEPPKGKLGSGEARRRFISPRKEYPVKQATKADAEAAKKLADSAPVKNGSAGKKAAPEKAEAETTAS